MTHNKTLLSQAQNQSARLQALWRLATNRSKSDEEKARLMLSLAREMLDVDAVMIGEASGGQFVIRYVEDGLGLFRIGEKCPLDVLCCAATQSQESAYFYNLHEDERFRDQDAVRKAGLQVYAGIPIYVDEELFGTLVFLRQKTLENEEFSGDDKVFMELLANWFGLMLLRSRQTLALQTQALTDELTGLPNRRAAELRFAEEIARAKRDDRGFAVAIADLDRFKLVNDNFGHEIGDEVLCQASHSMRGALREGDWIARWGGEEFILFLHHSVGDEAYSAVERVRQAVRNTPCSTRSGTIEVTSSFGVGEFQPDDADMLRTLSEADGCLYEAKRRGRDCVVASEGREGTTLWRAGVLQRALQEKRVVAAYQVMADLKTGKIVADEALARLTMNDGSIIPAGEFIEAAEGVNLIHEVDRVIVQQSMSRCTTALEGGFDPDFAHFVNLSPQFLARRELVEQMLDSAIAMCPCDIEFKGNKPLVFEITERQLLTDFESMRKDLEPLLDFGFRLALDDFGSGYSSFLYLAELPVSFLKIEGWMVQNLRSNVRVRHMVESMVSLSQRLGITTIAEFVEDRETADLLREMGVDWGQGYFFGKPEL